MTNQEKKETLWQYRAAEREEKRIEQEIIRWRSRAEKMTAGYGPPHGGSGDGRSLEHTVERLAILTSELVDQQNKLISLRRWIGGAINSVGDDRLRELLRLRYIEGMTWEQISVLLHYSYMQVCRLHGKALDQLKM